MKAFYNPLIFLSLILLNTQIIYPQWVQTNGPGDGTINRMAANGNVIITRASNNGIYLSTNKGSTWQQVYNELPFVYSFIFKGTNILAGTSEGIYLTSDNGISWTQENNGLTNTDVRCLAVFETHIFAGTYGGGVFISNNSGANWVPVNNGLMRTNVFSFALRDSSLFAGTDSGGVFLTTSNGNNWVQVNNGLPNKYNVTALAASDSSIFAISSGVYKSTDNGANWSITTLSSSAFTSLVVIGTKIYVGRDQHYLGDVYRSTNNGANWQRIMGQGSVLTLATNGDILYASVYDIPDFMFGRGVFMSTDFGTSWTQIGLPVSQVLSLMVNDNNIFAGTYYGIFHSTNPDGTNFNKVGLAPFQVNAIIINGNNIFAAASSAGSSFPGLAVSSNNGANWAQSSLSTRNSYSLANSGTNIYAGIYDGGFAISTNNGISWTSSTPVSGKINSIAATEAKVFIANGNYIYLSTNNGTNWVRRDDSITNYSVYTLVLRGENILAGTSGGIFLSTNDGSNWAPINNGLTNILVRSIVFSGDNIFAGTGNGVFQSTNNGSEWTHIGLDNLTVLSLGITQSYLLAGTYGAGLWYRSLSELGLPVELTSFTASGGKGSIVLKWNTATELNNMGFDVERYVNKSDWMKISFVKGSGNSTSTINYSYVDKSISKAGKYYYRLKQIDNDGSYKYSNIAEAEFDAPTVYALNQNYPNPFNPSTMISYRLKDKGFVKLKVYGIKGDLVKVLVNEMKEAGYYESEFDGKGLASGFYIYRIEVIGDGNKAVYSDMKKTVLLK
jgi:photosystem II stability/assembly factor-like uncharacterized protein